MSPDRASQRHFGLRGRLTAALVLTSAVTLAAVAVALLAPLQNRLTTDRIDTLATTMSASRPIFARLPPRALRPRSEALLDAAQLVHKRTGGEVAVFDQRGRLLAATDTDSVPPAVDVARAALPGRHAVRRVIQGPEEREALVAMRMESGEQTLTVVVTKSLDDVDAAARRVRDAFLIAALIGLSVATLVGILLATGLVRRLRDLRRATLKVAELGPEVELAVDRRRDEVGDLTRAFVTLQQRLREQEQARRTFVATASHELRTPLASLGLMLEMLGEDLAAGSPDLELARKQVDEARGQSDRLSKLAAQLLDLSRIDAGVPLSRELVDLRELCRAVLAEFEPRAPGALDLIAADACWAVADPASVARVVRILIDNALRFTPAGERVRVTVSCEADRSTIAISDRGPGVAEAERELIFERFRRGAGTSDDGGGFGLGLAIGRELAERMEGELRLDAASGGACFVLTLPGAPRVDRDAASAAIIRS